MNKKSDATEFTGKTAEEAIKKGLEQSGLTKETADIKIIDEGTSGLFGLMGSKPARVIIQPKGHAGAAPVQTAKPARPAQAKADKNAPKHEYKPSKDMENSIKNHLYKIFQLMDFSEEKPDIKVAQEQECQVDVDFKDSSISAMLIGKNGKVLRSIEIVLQSMINREFRGKMEYIPRVLLDINKYTAKQKEKIKEDVNEALKNINETGKPFRLAPMSPPLRKYVHVLLQDNPDFETISEGEDEQRRVVIKPRKN